MKILIIDSAPPCNLFQGSALIGHHLFKRLRHHHLILICPSPAQEMPYYQEVLAEMFDVVHLVPRARTVPTLAGLLEPSLANTRIPKRIRPDLASVSAFQQKVAEVAQSDSFDVIHTRQLPMAAMTAPIAHGCKLIELVDSEALQSLRRMRGGAPGTWLRYFAARLLEGRAVRPFQACTTVAEADAQMVRRIAPNIPVHVIPNGVDAAHFSPMNLPETPNTIIFTGAMSFPPNVTAVLNFHRLILPLIRRQLPDARFVIAGRDPAPEILALKSDPLVTVTGFAQDLRPILAQACVMVCPMLSGSGIKNKVLEAMAMARPVVSTSRGIEALEVVDGRELRIANSPPAFASTVVDLLGDPIARRRIGDAGREFVMRGYTWDTCGASYDALYADLVRQDSLKATAKSQEYVSI